ncbi:MAG: hypothetical protein IPP07_14050 [Holophagales bacterium]|nr:hypothetical protein [Holophagales bacterium]
MILGGVLKSCVVDGTTYYWREYLLKETKTEAYHFLSESNGHWTLLEPIPAGEVSKAPRLASARDPLPALPDDDRPRQRGPRRVLLGGEEGRDDRRRRLRRPRGCSRRSGIRERGRLVRGSYLPKEELEQASP